MSQIDEVAAARNADYDDLGLKVARTDAEIGVSLETQRRHLLDIKRDWDGYGADRIPEGVIDVIFEDIVTEGEFVQMVPGADGSVQAEWHMRGDVSVEYNVSPGGKRCLYVSYKPLPRA